VKLKTPRRRRLYLLEMIAKLKTPRRRRLYFLEMIAKLKMLRRRRLYLLEMIAKLKTSPPLSTPLKQFLMPAPYILIADLPISTPPC